MRITIVGLGVIGGSFGMALKRNGYTDVYGIDKDLETIKKAKDIGIIKEGYLDGKEILKTSDLVIISIYPKLILDFIKENKEFFKKGSVITDATGIKEMFIEDIVSILPSSVDFIFGHPMAGREKKGIDYADDKVFNGANYIITPISINKEENIELIENLAFKLGFKKVKKISSKYHDEMIAFTSQLPHVIAVSLINSDEEGRDTGSFIGDSYRDLTRIANINEELWSELFLGNKKNLLKAIDDFDEELLKIRKAIENEEKNILCGLFKKSTSRREQL
ncbi:prephenate dehydrogenase [Clostridium baratii]|uniref:prephenate dehydrogenase n=1 Tax=Clostridium baratii TaxID=1561 RepID=UPI00097FB83C|nr:prephenate dehydrogenase [Clostridium baratii]AQM60860.1 prephenate dehydrogenase [Clostridium baratii]